MIKGRKDLAILYSKKKMIFLSDLKYLRCDEFETADIAYLSAESKNIGFQSTHIDTGEKAQNMLHDSHPFHDRQFRTY
ncbi:hypothetical protein [Candidatus Methanomassiliicoccus intestinalis]|uniref:Uncharacterized protein n=1 Tax=Candidatus Methanomassiliicoccus intestinalis TaxID=1406512 RepID=A0A8J8PG53_9ARCH|nr:MAG: hypothetical protein A3207_08590 [Candidatus Methanomassiliicoccus intestinalis]